jgi:hypothetical protein
MDNKTKKLIEELNQLKNQLSEKFIFEMGEMGNPGMMQGDHMQGHMYQEQPDPALVQQNPQAMMGQGDSEEEIAMHAQEVIQHEPIIGKIRETAIEGLKKYSDHPTSSLYEFFKKVFLESDKVLTDTGGKK